ALPAPGKPPSYRSPAARVGAHAADPIGARGRRLCPALLGLLSSAIGRRWRAPGLQAPHPRMTTRPCRGPVDHRRTPMAQIFDGQSRFGIHAGPQNTGYADYVRLWQTAEASGYDWASVFDHFIPIQSDPHGPCLEGPTLLAAMAAQTSRLRCGILVVGNTYRHPAVQANIAATLDHISGGR